MLISGTLRPPPPAGRNRACYRVPGGPNRALRKGLGGHYATRNVSPGPRSPASRRTRPQVPRRRSKRAAGFILGARHRNSKEIKEKVLTHPAPLKTVAMPRARKTPLALEVKEVHVKDVEAEDGEAAGEEPGKPSARRTVVCCNPAQAGKDAASRKAILKKLHEKLERDGPKSLVGNRGFKRYLSAKGGVFEVDHDKIQSEAHFDGLWVLRTNTDFNPREIAARYKALWMVKQGFRTSKGILDTRPIFHKCDETIRGHVFCSFLALV